MWGDADHAEVIAVWGEELGRYQLDDIKSAIETLRVEHVSYPPTLFEFSMLCRDAARRSAQAKMLGAPRETPDPEALAKINEMMRGLTTKWKEKIANA